MDREEENRKIEKCLQPDRIRAAWINYQLRINGYTQTRLAREIGVSQPMVRQVIYGLRTSARVQKAIAKAIGSTTWNEVLAHGPTRKAVAA